jgi:hypothetical protein
MKMSCESTSSHIVDLWFNYNTTLNTIEGFDNESTADEERIEWLLITIESVHDPGQVPQGWWPPVLTRIAIDHRHDVMFHLVTPACRDVMLHLVTPACRDRY